MRLELSEIIKQHQEQPQLTRYATNFTERYSIVLDLEMINEHSLLPINDNVFWKTDDPNDKSEWSEGYTIYQLTEVEFAHFVLTVSDRLVTMDSV